jgi:hypothetical protein
MIEIEKVTKNSCTCYYKKGTETLHREDGPAVTFHGGIVYWYKDGYLHREDGPAITFPGGSLRWYRYGKLHRIDGPAVVHPDGRINFYLNGVEFKNKSEFIKKLTEEFFNSLSDDDKIRLLFSPYFIKSN